MAVEIFACNRCGELRRIPWREDPEQRWVSTPHTTADGNQCGQAVGDYRQCGEPIDNGETLR